jgi:hypothetical protein
MPQVSMTGADVGDLETVDVEELYADLAIAEAGSEAHVGTALESVAAVRALVAADPAALADPLGGLVRKGKQIFNRYWPAVKTVVCKLYESSGDDWIAAAATAIAALLGVGGAVAALILKIAIKIGMALICAADASPQPA